MRGLVISGGGVKASHSTGALLYLLGDLKIKYDILAGVSAGAICVAFLAQFVNEQEKEAVEELSNWWLKLTNDKIYKKWKPFGKLHAAWKKSFYDSSPLANLLQNNISLEKIRMSGKNVSVGAVSLSSGKYTIFNQNDDDFIQGVIASSSFPSMFLPVKIRDQLWVDGGLKQVSPIDVAINAGATEIDVLITSPETRIKKFIENPSILDIFKRSIDLSTDKIMSNDIEKVEMYNKLAEAGLTNKKVVKLNIIRPKFNLIEDLLDFDPIKIQKMMEIGYLDAKTSFKP